MVFLMLAVKAEKILTYMIDLTTQITQAQIAVFLGVIALLLTVYFFGKFPDTLQKQRRKSV